MLVENAKSHRDYRPVPHLGQRSKIITVQYFIKKQTITNLNPNL